MQRKDENHRRDKCLWLRATTAERARIAANAKLCGLPVSRFLREIALGFQPPAAAAPAGVDELLPVAANLARLGNLLKLWLDNREKFDATQAISVRRLFELLADDREQLRAAIDRLIQAMNRYQ